MMRKACVVGFMGLGWLLVPGAARGGGFELPDNGTEALGRGGAFVAKADDGTALQYNIAGLARQRGTRVTLNSNFILHDVAFTRAGVYPGDPADTRTPYAGQPYPTIRDRENLFIAPMVAVSSDFGYFERWTFALGVYGPPSIGRHNYGVAERAAGAKDDPSAEVTLPNGMKAPAPSRYDITKTDLLIVYPTLAAAARVHRVLDVGLAVQMVYATFALANANLTPLGPSNCPVPDYAGCDSYANINVSGTTFTGLASVMLHPKPWLDLGATLRPPIDIKATGTLHPVTAPVATAKLQDSPVHFRSNLPLWLRLGGRLVSRYPDGTERADVEVNLVWERWSAAEGPKPATKEVVDATTCSIYSDEFLLGKGGELCADIVHNYRDTFGVRVGGAYNHRLSDTARLTGRVGFYFDSAATSNAATRLDFNTAEKFGFTVGAGLKWRGLGLNLAYAYVYSPVRQVSDSEITALSGLNGNPVPGTDAVIAVGNGRYEPMTQILSVGLTVNFGELRRATLLPN